jgi:hypothetical protein
MKRPEAREAGSYYFKYIDRVPEVDVVGVLARQKEDASALLGKVSEERSLHRYAADKWSFRQVLNHVVDCERVFVYRALWFARGFDSPLPSFEQDIAVTGARADDYTWASHLEDFRAARAATLTFFRNLPEAAWDRTGVASDNPVSVRALAFIIAGHAEHHLSILRERYL